MTGSLLAVFGCPHVFHLLRCVSPRVKSFHQTGEIASVFSLEFPDGATDCVTRGQPLLEDEVIDVKQSLIREHDARNAWMIRYALVHGLHFRDTSSGPPSEPKKKVMQIVAPAGAKEHAFQSGQPIEAICSRYSMCVSIADTPSISKKLHIAVRVSVLSKYF